MTDENTQFSRRTLLKAAGATGAVAATGSLAAATPGRDPSVDKTDEVLVGVSAGHDLEATVAQHVPSGAEIVHSNDGLRYVSVKFQSGSESEMQAFIDSVTKKPGIKYAEFNTTHYAFYTPDDPKYPDQYAQDMVNAPTAWDTTLGDSSVTIAIVDQGIQYDHADLDGNMDGSESNYGQDFVDNDEDPYPDVLKDEYHGTHVGGIAAAELDNGTGVASQGNSSLLSARALNENGSGQTSDIADAVKWAADQGAEVINMSLGGGGYTDTMKNAVSYAYDNGSLLVAAAGNDGTNSVSYPAAYSECIAVSALDSDGTLASYSNYGSEIELTAPGSNVLSTTTSSRGDYEKLSGTSMATPVVSGVAGLTLAQWNLTNKELRNHLKGTADDIGLSSDKQGCGRVDSADAIGTDPANRSSNCSASGGGGGGTCGDKSTTSSVSDSLTSSSDYDCWTYAWSYSSPCQVVVDLSGPTDADFDLYVSEAETDCPGPYDYDYRSISTDSQETVTIDNPDTSTDLQISVDSYSGSGTYDLSVTEKSK